MEKCMNKTDNYKIERFTEDQLTRLQHDVYIHATAINGLPKNHAEVYEKRGWLLPFLISYDSLLWGRWEYWLEILWKGSIKDCGPIPQIQWSSSGEFGFQNTKKMLNICMSHPEAQIDNFAEWLMWGLAISNDESLKISSSLNSHYYKNFDIFLILDNPYDYLSSLLSENTGSGYKSGLGYFPTPFTITQMMVSMAYSDRDPEELKRLTVYDPCVGCGAMLLPASNYSLRGAGQDISRVATALCQIQFHFYAPWYARPGKVNGFDTECEPLKLHVNRGQLEFAF